MCVLIVTFPRGPRLLVCICLLTAECPLVPRIPAPRVLSGFHPRPPPEQKISHLCKHDYALFDHESMYTMCMVCV